VGEEGGEAQASAPQSVALLFGFLFPRSLSSDHYALCDVMWGGGGSLLSTLFVVGSNYRPGVVVFSRNQKALLS